MYTTSYNVYFDIPDLKLFDWIMPKIYLPKRKYMSGQKLPLTIRVPEELLKELKRESNDTGFNLTTLILTVLDNHVQNRQRRGR